MEKTRLGSHVRRGASSKRDRRGNSLRALSRMILFLKRPCRRGVSMRDDSIFSQTNVGSHNVSYCDLPLGEGHLTAQVPGRRLDRNAGGVAPNTRHVILTRRLLDFEIIAPRLWRRHTFLFALGNAFVVSTEGA